jgi:hypothetical protein
MSTTTQTAQPDLAAVKARQQKMWSSGNYAAVAARIVPMAEHLAEAAGLRPGDRVLGRGHRQRQGRPGRGAGDRLRRGRR